MGGLTGGVTGGVTGGLEKSNSLIIMYLAKNRGGLCKNIKIHILQKIYKHYLDCNSSAPHGMKTKIFNNLQ